MNAQAWADRLIGSIDWVWQSVLGRDPKLALSKKFKLEVVQTKVPPLQRGYGGLCDGISIIDEQKILYVPTKSRRQNFTLLHELAHFLARQCDELLAWAADQDNPSRAIEEICDRFAATILVPNTLVDGVLDSDKLEAAHILKLYNGSAASREVCAIALVRYLGCEGFVALIERSTNAVTFATRVADTRPYAWRGDPIPASHPLRTLGVSKHTRCLAWWPYPDGEHREFYLDAVSDERYVYAVLADSDLWGIAKLHLTDPVTVTRRSGDFSMAVQCSSCGFTGVTRQFPCPDCGRPYCPKCGQCECDRRRQGSGVCTKCRCIVPTRRLENGICNDCRQR